MPCHMSPVVVTWCHAFNAVPRASYILVWSHVFNLVPCASCGISMVSCSQCNATCLLYVSMLACFQRSAKCLLWYQDLILPSAPLPTPPGMFPTVNYTPTWASPSLPTRSTNLPFDTIREWPVTTTSSLLPSQRHPPSLED